MSKAWKTTAWQQLADAMTEVETEGGVIPCAVQPHVWDGEASPMRIAAAMSACHSCPVASMCSTWLDSGATVTGVVAGEWRCESWDRPPRQVKEAQRLTLAAGSASPTRPDSSLGGQRWASITARPDRRMTRSCVSLTATPSRADITTACI